MATERMNRQPIVLAVLLSIPLDLLICWTLLLLASRVGAQVSCPTGQVGYDIQAGEYLYAEGDDFKPEVEGTGAITWTIRPECHVSCVCIADDVLYWLPYASAGSWDGGREAVFWGGCQAPGPMPRECLVAMGLPPRAFVPLVMK
jgi:hypothetical protein